MTEEQRVSLRMSEVRQRLNELSGEEDSSLDEMSALSSEYQRLETRWRAATILDTPPSSEVREWASVAQGVELRAFLQEAATGVPTDGASAEFRQHLFGDKARPGLVPFEALLPIEHRADVVTAAPAEVGLTSHSVMERVFADTASAYLGVSMPSVGVGESVYPVMTGGTSAQMLAKSTAVEAAAATFTTTTLAPIRLTARYLFGVEDAARMSGMEEILRRDMAAVFGNAMDTQVLTGSGTAPEVQGFIGGLGTPTAPTGQTVFNDFVKNAASAVDGYLATGLSGVRQLVAPATYRLAATLVSTNGDVPLADYMSQKSGGFRVSANIPPVKAKKQDLLMYKSGRGAGSAVAPVWAGFDLIRDPYTNAASGQVAITAMMLWNFAILRTDAYDHIILQVEA